jgi:hypothetical protein
VGVYVICKDGEGGEGNNERKKDAKEGRKKLKEGRRRKWRQ